MVVAILGAIIPTLKLSKLPIKNIIFALEEDKKVKRKGYLKFCFANLMFFIATATPRRLVKDFNVVFEVAAVAMVITYIIIIIPYIVDAISSVISIFSKDVGSNMVYLSISNFENNKNILSNITLLAVSLSTFILVNSITSSAIGNKDDLYRDNAKFDMFVWYESSNSSLAKDEIERLCSSDKNVTDSYTTLISSNHPIDGTNYKIEKLQSGDINEFFNYWNVSLTGNPDINKVKDELNNGRNVIITYVMRDRLNVNLGETIPLHFGNKIIK